MGHKRHFRPGPTLCAISDQSAAQQISIYSITSSAMEHGVSGMVVAPISLLGVGGRGPDVCNAVILNDVVEKAKQRSRVCIRETRLRIQYQ
jgi:hypothetical protein